MLRFLKSPDFQCCGSSNEASCVNSQSFYESHLVLTSANSYHMYGWVKFSEVELVVRCICVVDEDLDVAEYSQI